MKHIFYSTRVALILILGILTGQMSALNPLTQKLRQCSFTGPNSTFCNLNVLNQACIGGNLNVGGIITGIDGLGYGNTLIVDQVDGNDDIGAANGPRFKTISAALLQAEEGDLVLVYPGVYNETLVVPEDVIVAGVEINTVTIQQLNVTTPTDLIVLGEGSTLANLNLILTSGVDVQLRAINHISPGGSDLSAININNVRIQVTNYSAVPTTSDTIGCAFTGTSTPTVYDLIGVALMQVVSNSTGRTRGVYSEAAQYLLLNGCAINIIGGTNAIGIETTDTTTQTYCFDSLVGGTTADISQTSGTLGLSSTYLINSTANGLSFDSLIYPSFFIWADSDNPVGPGDTLYLRPGTGFASFTPILISALQQFVAITMTVRVLTPPGVGESTTWTLQRKRPSDLVPVDTVLSLTLSDLETTAVMNSVSAHFDRGDDICMQMVSTAGAQTGDVIVSVGIY